MKLSIRSKIVIVIIMPIVVIYLAIMMFNIFEARQWTITNAEKRMGELSISYADRFDSLLREAAQAAKLTAAFIESYPRPSSELIYAQLQANLQINPLVYGSAVCFEPFKYQPGRRLFVRYVYRDGDVLRKEDPAATGYDYTEPKQEYWHMPRTTGKALWTEPYFDEGGGNILMATYSVPFFSNGMFLGITTVDIPLEPLREMADLGISRDFDFFIVTKAGKYVYSPHLERINKSIFSVCKQSGREDMCELARVVASGKTGAVKIPGWESKEREWIFYAPVASARWGFAVSIPEKQVLSPVREQFYRNIAFLIISLFLIAVSLWFLSVRISRPITQLNKAVSELSKGNLGIRADISSNDEIGALAGAFNDMAKQLSEREQALRASESKFRAIFDQTFQFVGLMAPDGTLLEANRTSLNFYGIDEQDVAGKLFWEAPWWAHSEVLRERLRQATKKAAAGEFVRFEITHPLPDGTHYVDFSLKPIKDESDRVVFLIPEGRDITVRRQAEEEKRMLQAQLNRAEKMETIGTLAGGVAHDLNNILGAIVGYPDLMLDDIPKDSPLRNSVLAIKESGERAASVVQDLLTLARRGIAITEVENLNNIITRYLGTREFLKLKEFYPYVQLETNLTTDLLNILGSPVHLSKVVMNLVSNAAEAMPGGGKITIFTENIYLDKPIKGYDIIEEGDYVVLTVSDDGIGIPEVDLKRIFEPFYTKKVMGRSGTGLGMAVVWGTVKDHKGYIDVDSQEGTGTTFKLYFPVTRKGIEDPQGPVSIEEYVGNGQKILVIDDVKAQREIASSMLTKLNYTVAAVVSGEEAVGYLKNNTADLLVIDMIMDPGIDGLETYKKILETRPDQKAIIASGVSETDRVKAAQNIGAGAYIKKPYTLEKIGLAVKAELQKQF